MFSDSALLLISHLRTVSHATGQGLTLVHFSAHHERLLRDTLGGAWSFSDKSGSS